MTLNKHTLGWMLFYIVETQRCTNTSRVSQSGDGDNYGNKLLLHSVLGGITGTHGKHGGYLPINVYMPQPNCRLPLLSF